MTVEQWQLWDFILGEVIIITQFILFSIIVQDHQFIDILMIFLIYIFN